MWLEGERVRGFTFSQPVDSGPFLRVLALMQTVQHDICSQSTRFILDYLLLKAIFPDTNGIITSPFRLITRLCSSGYLYLYFFFLPLPFVCNAKITRMPKKGKEMGCILRAKRGAELSRP